MSRNASNGLCRILASGVALTLALGSGSKPCDAAELRWKFKEGEILHYQLVQKTTTIMMLDGREMKTVVEQTIDSTWVVKSVVADGSAQMTMTFDRIKGKLETPLARIEYDSAEPKEPVGDLDVLLAKTLQPLVGAAFNFKLSAIGAVSDVQIPKSLLEALKKAPAGDPQMLTEEGWKNLIKESSLPFPLTNLEVGGGWNSQGISPLWPGASLKMEKAYQYHGPEAKLEKVTLDVKLTLDAPPDPKFEAKLDSPRGKGTFLFDNNAGRMVSAEYSQKIAMNIKAGSVEDTRSTETTNVMTLVLPKPAEAAAKKKSAEK